MDLILRERAVKALELAGLDSFIGPLTRCGYLVLEEATCLPNFDFIEEHFHKPARQGVVLYPCGFGDFESMKAAAEQYVQALAEQGLYADLLLCEDPIFYTVFVFVPEAQEQARMIGIVLKRLNDNGRERHDQAVAAGYKDAICPACSAVILAHCPLIRCENDGCPMAARNIDGSLVRPFNTLMV